MAGVSATGRLLKEIEDAIYELTGSIKNLPDPVDRVHLAEAIERLAKARKDIAQ